MTTTQTKQREFREERTPGDVTYKKDSDKVVIRISRFDHILMTFQVFVAIGITALGLSGTNEINNIVIFSILFTLNVVWIITNLRAKLSLTIFDDHLEFVFGKFNLKKINLNLNEIVVAKIETNIIGGSNYGGIPGMNSKTTKFRNLIIELKNGKEHYIPLLEDNHKRYFSLLINKYKI